MQEQGQFNMTQALNLANFANNLNTAGATSNSGLQNSSVTVTAGTGMSGGGAVALGSSVTLNNAGVTSVAAGTGISVSTSTGGVTITNIAPSVTAGEAKAWVNFVGSTGAITASYNVSSITRISTGIYTVNFTNAFADTKYTMVVGSEYQNATNSPALIFGNTGTSGTKTTSPYGVVSYSSSFAFLDTSAVYLAFYR